MAFGIGKFFGKKAVVAKENLKRLENRDLMEAMVGGCMLIAFADGECEESELKKIDQILSSSKALEGFGNEINITIDRYAKRLEAGYRIGRMEILREIDDVKGSQQEKEDVFLAMLTVYEADGEIEEAERKELDAVAKRLGLRVEDYM